MQKEYSNVKAMLAITKASLTTIFRSPQAVTFSLVFPIIMIVIFGSLGGNSAVKIAIAFDKNTDTNNAVYHAISAMPVFEVKSGTQEELSEQLKKGRLTAIVKLAEYSVNDSSNFNHEPFLDVHLITSSASQKDLPVLKSVLKDLLNTLNARFQPPVANYASISQEVLPGRQYKMIDFYLPGMLGFSLIGASVFGVAFVLYSLRETLVLKRMYSTPIKRVYIILGESISRILFQLSTSVVIILFGTLVFDFTLSNGWITFLELMALSFVGLSVFMGFGFLVSGLAKNQNVIPIYSNLFLFPQYFLSGTFFPKSMLPEVMQHVVQFLPLTALNDAMRNVSFEGAHLYECWPQLFIMGGWAVLIFYLANRFFKWE
jgi:ABC-2 type transport system permease protein